MKKGTLIILAAAIVGLLLILGGRFALPFLQEKVERETSDAAAMKGKIVLGLDNWIGYSVFNSSRMKQEVRNNGYGLVCEDDNADLEGRMKKLQDGTLNFAVATVDSYILNAADKQFPGTIIAVVDQSQGGDAIVAYKDQVENLDALKTRAVKIAYTPNSPSHHLLKAAAAHFDIGSLRNLSSDLRIETNGSTEALKSFKKREVPVAVLWEPEVSKALSMDGVIKLLGTENTSKLIVDTLIVSREYSQTNPDAVRLLLSSYFRTLKYYREHPEELQKEIRANGNMSEDMARQMLDGVKFVNLTENCEEWFGISGSGMHASSGLVDTIDSTIDILMDSGDFTSNPLPDKDPYRITNRTYLEELFSKHTGTGFVGAVPAGGVAGIRAFEELSPIQWDLLREVGTLKVEPITFQSGTSILALEGREQLDIIAEKIGHYPAFRVLIKGHTDIRGDKEANRELSQVRADAVVRYLHVTHSIDPLRIRALGLGGTKPLPRRIDESERAYHNRLSRVEISLLTEVF